ncbi:MAG: KamA family radical SAM protein [Bdellovibrionaceae bacterium]|nr:KamA family radical SAM protein [Pseudobdellovibrionaceae bacterium]
MPLFKFEKNPPIPQHLSITENEWMNPQWQMQNALKKEADFACYFDLQSDESSVFHGASDLFNIRCTPYYASLAQNKPHHPIRKILMPNTRELVSENQEMLDPLGEKRNLKSRRLIHRYSDRALLLITDFCSVYCRYCTRKHFTGQDQVLAKKEELDEALLYIKSHPGIKEVIISGGDPLTLSDAVLDRVFFEIRKIEHVEIIRLGSRMPVVCPQRITEDLCRILKKYKPVYFMNHFNHPKEITELAAQKLEMIVDHGVPSFNQMVLLNGVNNHEAIVQALSRRMLYLRVKPYYMFQCDPSKGTDYLRTSISNSLKIQKNLWGHLSGLAMPNLAVDIPNGGGKTYYSPNFETERQDNTIFYRGWDGVEGAYVSPNDSEIIEPIDAEDYFSEWDLIRNSKK